MSSKVSKIVDSVLECSIAGSFSRAGYETRSRILHWRPVTDYDMSSKTVIVTGPTSGLGKEVATTLRSLNANLILVARNREKLTELSDELSSASGSGTIESVVADMGNLSQVEAACVEIASKRESIDALIHNAGALLNAFTRTDDGLETTIASHVVGPFVMTSRLLPLLEKANGRVITVSSGGMYSSGVPHLRQGGSLEMAESSFNGTKQYALAKRAQVTLNEIWARKISNVQFHAMHPGWADTPGVQSALPGFYKVTRALLRTPAQGADTIVWLAAETNLPADSGSFWCDRTVRSLHRLPTTKRTDTESARDALWAWCAHLAEVSAASG
jgi:dehydrogenase/reductase SDR family member 12